ncbi:MAG: SocA family protein [Candidatus Cloacimonetes bacterium]|nr:SocA family protein [Candidatus Cloacimonadota bacterium]
MNIKKIVTILNYLSTKIPYLTKLKVAKLLYFLDKEHFIRYGRFVTNDYYVKLKYGPVPTRILNIINNPNISLMHKSILNFLSSNISFGNEPNRTVKSRKSPDLDELSKSEIEVLDYIIEKYGRKHIGELINFCHKEFAWKNTQENEFFSVEDIIHNLKEDRKQELLKVYEDYKTENKELRIIYF